MTIEKVGVTAMPAPTVIPGPIVIAMIYPLTNCDPTVTHSDITAAGVVDTKIKSIGS